MFNDYLKARKDLKPTTTIDYGRALNQVVPDWFCKPITSITREMIAKRHAEHGETKSKARLNHKMTHDVTAGYIMLDVERLRKPMQQITDFLVKQMNNAV